MEKRDPNAVSTIPVPNVPKVRVPYTEDHFRTDSCSALALDMMELVATINQAATPEVEYMTDALTKGMIGLTHTPAGQTLGIAGSALLVAPQHVELTHTLVAAARHQTLVRKKLPKLVEGYTIVPHGQSQAWQSEPEMAYLKLQCQMEAFLDIQYQALREKCSEGFKGAAEYYRKFSTLFQVLPNDIVRRAIDYDGVVSNAVGITASAADRYTPTDMTTAPTTDDEGRPMPYRVPNLMARQFLRHNTMLIQGRTDGQGYYNTGGIPTVKLPNGTSPMVIARAEGGQVQREIILSGPVGHFTADTTAATIAAEKETVSVEPEELETPTELVSTMQRSLHLRPLSVTLEIRTLLKPFKFTAHLSNPNIAYTQHRTSHFPFDTKKLNAFSPVPVRHTPRNTQFQRAANFVNCCTSYEQFKVFMLS